jgi:Ala-tRNA(Pro) deacylase
MNVQDYLKQQNVSFEVLKHRRTFEAQRLAHAVHASGYEVAKTVLLRTEGQSDSPFVVAVVPATHMVDLMRASKALGMGKVDLASEEDIAEHCRDCERGALPPFGSQYGMKTVVDDTLTTDEQIVFEGNTHAEAIRMKFKDFQRLEQPQVASFTRHG